VHWCASLVEPVRRDPNATAERVTEALLWDEVIVEERGAGWLRVTILSQAGYEGWMPEGAVREGSRPTGDLHVVTAPFAPLSLRGDEPGSCGGGLWMGSCVHVRRADRSIAVVHGPDGSAYQMAAALLRPVGEAQGASRAERGRAAAACALSLVGVPYLWGGMTYRGIDCSGLVQVAMRSVGRTVRRDADMQYDDGVPLLPDQAQPGDAAFFEANGKVMHAALMIDGEHFVHAYGNTQKVSVNTLSEPWFAEHLAGVCRLL
jgi:cell wall-associated NlpC family hydrolase